MGKRQRLELAVDVAAAMLLILVGEWRLVRWRRYFTLALLNRKVSGNLRQKLAFIAIRQLRRFLLDLVYIALTIWFIILLVDEAQSWPYGSLVAPVLYGIAFFASYLAIPAVYIWIRLHNAETTIPLRLMSLLSYLDKRSNLREWSLRDRGKLNRRVEQLARLYELLGPALRPGDPVTAAEYQRWSRGLGARMRELKVWMLRPSPTTYTDMVSRLSEDLEMVLASRWDRLTSADPGALAPQPSRLSRLAWGAAGVFLVAGALLIVAYSTEFGTSATVFVTLLGSGGFLALAKAGLPLQLWGEAQGAFSKTRAEGLADKGT